MFITITIPAPIKLCMLLLFFSLAGKLTPIDFAKIALILTLSICLFPIKSQEKKTVVAEKVVLEEKTD